MPPRNDIEQDVWYTPPPPLSAGELVCVPPERFVELQRDAALGALVRKLWDPLQPAPWDFLEAIADALEVENADAQATRDAALGKALRPHLKDVLNAIDVYRFHLASRDCRFVKLDEARGIIADALEAENGPRV